MNSIPSLEDLQLCEDPYLIDDGLFEQAMSTPSGIPQDVLDKIDAIDQGLEAYGQLCHIAEIVASNESFDAATIAVARVAMETIKKPLGIFDNEAVVAVEAFTAKGISVEGFTDTLKTIWDAIVRTFNAIRNAVMNVIRGSKAKAHAQVVQKLSHDVKVAKAEQSKPQAEAPVEVFKPSAEHLTIRIKEASKHFAFLGEDLKPGMLLAQAGSLNKALSRLDHMSEEMVKSATGMRAFVDNLDGKVLTGKNHTALGPETSVIAKDGMNSYFHGVYGAFTQGGDLRKYAKELLEKNAVPFNRVTPDSIRHLDGFTRGITIFAFCTAGNTMRELAYRFFISPEEAVESDKVVVDFKSIEEFEVYCDVVHTTFEDYMRIIKDYESRCTSIFSIQDKTLQKMDVHLRSLHANQRELKLYIEACREIARVSSVAMHALNSFMMIGERSLYDHSALLRALHTLMKPQEHTGQ